jgi:S1-C subfamily serine protease
MSVKVNSMIGIHSRSAFWTLAVCLASGAWTRPAAAIDADVRRDATVEVVEQVMPSVVNIAIATLKERNVPYYRMMRDFYRNWPKEQFQSYSVGSGVIIDEAGFLITNFHVVEDATLIQVKLSTGEVFDAEHLVRTSQRDIALLQIKAPPGRKFQAMKFAKDDDLLLGETVIAIGNPYGLGGSVTRGILSSKNRREFSGDGRLDVPDWLQTDAGINPGNSGGPLINLRGELIGINVAVHREAQGAGVSFAIPVKQINVALADFFTPEVTDQHWFGARPGSFNAPFTINFVQPRSPAEQAGLRVGQRVVSVNSVAPRNLTEFLRLVTARLDTDARATFEVEDADGRRSLTMQLMPFDELTKRRLGVVFGAITPRLAADLNVQPGTALVIQSVEPGSPADRMNLRPGFLVTALDDRKTGFLVHAADVISSKAPGERIKVAFYVPARFGGRFGNFQTTVTVR